MSAASRPRYTIIYEVRTQVQFTTKVLDVPYTGMTLMYNRQVRYIIDMQVVD